MKCLNAIQLLGQLNLWIAHINNMHTLQTKIPHVSFVLNSLLQVSLAIYNLKNFNFNLHLPLMLSDISWILEIN